MSETTYHFPLGGTTIGLAVVFVVLDMTALVRLGRIQDWQTIRGNQRLRYRVYMIESVHDNPR